MAARRSKGGTAPFKEYHLGYFNLWWSRMTREGVREERMRMEREEMNIKKRRFRLLLKAKLKTKIENPALESEVDKSMMEDRDSVCVEEVRMVMEYSAASQNPGNCREFDINIGGKGGVVSGGEIIVIQEQTKDFEMENLTTSSMNDTTGCFGELLEPGLSAEDIMDKEK